MKDNKRNLKYVIIVAIMFVVGILIGVTFSSMSKTKGTVTNISKEKAKTIALENAQQDFTENKSLDTEVYVEMDKEKGEDVYEVKFVLGGVDYEYKIRVSDGTIVDKDRELITNNNVNKNSNSNSNNSSNSSNSNATNSSNTSSNSITIESAKELALKDSNLSANSVTFMKAEKETEKGVSVYEIEFSSTDKKYDYEITVATGEIISKEVELKNKNVGGNSNISETEAKNIALKDCGFSASQVTIEKIELEREANYTAYEIEFYQGNKEYEYEIHINSGTILKYSWKLR